MESMCLDLTRVGEPEGEWADKERGEERRRGRESKTQSVIKAHTPLRILTDIAAVQEINKSWVIGLRPDEGESIFKAKPVLNRSCSNSRDSNHVDFMRFFFSGDIGDFRRSAEHTPADDRSMHGREVVKTSSKIGNSLGHNTSHLCGISSR